LILFADAADAEEPRRIPALLDKTSPRRNTVSVVGLVSETDCDAAFLKILRTRAAA
jgi:hypothetical protein